MLWRMVDVEQDGVKLSRGPFCVKAVCRIGREREEVTVYQSATWIAGERFAKRYQCATMPVDDRAEVFGHQQLTHPRVAQRRGSGVAQSQSADDDIQFGLLQPGEPEIGQRRLARGEQAGHQELVT